MAISGEAGAGGGPLRSALPARAAAFLARPTSVDAAAVAVLGFVLGIAGNLGPSAWWDEAATLSAVRKSPGDLLATVRGGDLVHVLYYLAAHVWALLLGSSLESLRALSAVGVAVTGALVVVLSRRLGFDRRTAAVAGVVAVAIPGVAWSALEARSYAWTAAMGVLLTLVLVLAVEGRRAWIAYGVLCFLSVILFLDTGLLVVAHGVALGIARRRYVRRWLLAAAIAGLATLPFDLLAHQQQSQVGWIHVGPSLLAWDLVDQAAGGLHGVHGTAMHRTVWLLGLVIAVLCLWWCVRRLRAAERWRPVLLLCWFLVPTLLLASTAFASRQFYQPRYLTFAAPAVAIVLAAALVDLVRSRRILGVAAVLACLALVSPILLAQRHLNAKDDNYLALARFAQRVHPQNVFFGPAGGRGIEVAYPGYFAGVRDLSIGPRGYRADLLFGGGRPVQQLSAADLRGMSTVVYAKRGAVETAVERRFAALGCSAGARTDDLRFIATDYRC